MRRASSIPLHHPAGPRLATGRRGSVLIVALLVAALIALVLGSYLSLNLGTARLAQRTFDRGAAFHLAEAGLEEGLWTYNRLLAGKTDAWEGWRTSGDSAWRRLENFQLTASTTGEIKIYASPLTPVPSTQPLLVALASVRSPGGAPVTQMIETTLRRRSFFAAGLVARESIIFRGQNTSFDSWDSDPDRDPATAAIPYSEVIRTDTGTIATGARDNTHALLNQARILGYVHTSGLVPVIGANGFIGPVGTPLGVVDTSRISHNFHADFPQISAPSDGVLITRFGATLGIEGQATHWRAPSLDLQGRSTLTILGDVTLTLTDALDAIRIFGSASLIIAPGSSLTVYTQGDVIIGGNGLANGNAAPSSLQLWSTAAPDRNQIISVIGNGAWTGVIYAPEAEITIHGNGDVAGAIVGRRLTFSGNAAFHYDLALADLYRHAPFRADGWRTVDTPAARASRLLLLNP